jgi:hypothetical protein
LNEPVDPAVSNREASVIDDWRIAIRQRGCRDMIV